MVQFNKGSFTITVHTTDRPEEQFRLLLEDMIDLLQSEGEEYRKNRYYYLELVKAMAVQVPAVSSN